MTWNETVYYVICMKKSTSIFTKAIAPYPHLIRHSKSENPLRCFQIVIWDWLYKTWKCYPLDRDFHNGSQNLLKDIKLKF